MRVRSLASLSGLRIRCCHSSGPALLWLWRRPVATALIGPLAWEPPYAAGAALEKKKKTYFMPGTIVLLFLTNILALSAFVLQNIYTYIETVTSVFR